MNVPEIVGKYRNGTSLRKFAASLSEKLPVSISHQAIKHWQDGMNTPRYYTIIPIAMHYTDWRREFALEVLGSINPEWARTEMTVEPLSTQPHIDSQNQS